MPGVYHIDTDRGVIFIRAWGTLTDAEVADLGIAVRADPRFRTDYRRIEDLRSVTTFAVTTGFAEEAARLHQIYAPPRRVFVVTSDLAFGMARMLGLLADASPDQFLVTRELDDALTWIGLDAAGGWPDDSAP